MITIFKSTPTGLEKLDEITNGCWVNVVDPTTDDLEKIVNLGVPQDFVTYPLDMDERPRTEREDDGTLLLLLRIPYFQGLKADVPYATIPLGVILVGQVVVTICRKPNEILNELSSGRLRNLSTAKRNRFILRLLLNTANRYLLYLREINKTVDIVEDQLQLSMQNKEVFELLKYQKSLVYFTTALRGNELMMERLQRSQLFRMYEEDEDLLEDVLTENQQAIEMVNISKDILSSTMDAFASIISNNLNQVMKFLTSVTILLSLPTIVTSFFGMNVELPFANISHTYWVIIGISVGVMTVVSLIFWKRDWF